jgi:LysR family transcriptional regulator, glycine cleavage system transcriptional activator
MNLSSNRLPPLNALRAFEAAARHLNFRVAAEELGVTQGAVAQHVRGLEMGLGIKLFERLPRSLALTTSGRSYAAQLRRAFELINDATAMLRPELHRLTISVAPTFASKWLIPHLPSFTQMHPDIELQILATENLANFHSDGVDIAVRQGQPPFGSAFIAELLFEQEIIAVGSPALLRDRAGNISLDDVNRLTLLSDAHDLWPEFIERALGGKPTHATKQVRFSQTSLAIDAAAAGQGLAVASRFFVEDDIRTGRLLQAFKPAMRVGMDFYVVTLRKPRHPAPTVAVKQWLLAYRNFDSP